MEPKGIAGWLILPAIGIVLSPVLIGWRALRNAQSAAAILAEEFQYTVGALVLVEFLCSVILVAGSLYLAYIFFHRQQTFPKAYIVFLTANVAVSVISLLASAAVLGSEIGASAFAFDMADWRGLATSLVWAIVWIPYTLKSRRVANTFVRI